MTVNAPEAFQCPSSRHGVSNDFSAITILGQKNATESAKCFYRSRGCGGYAWGVGPLLTIYKVNSEEVHVIAGEQEDLENSYTRNYTRLSHSPSIPPLAAGATSISGKFCRRLNGQRYLNQPTRRGVTSQRAIQTWCGFCQENFEEPPSRC